MICRCLIVLESPIHLHDYDHQIIIYISRLSDHYRAEIDQNRSIDHSKKKISNPTFSHISSFIDPPSSPTQTYQTQLSQILYI